MTFVTFTCEELATGPLSDFYPRLGSVGVIIGQMDDEYNVQFSFDCFDRAEQHETAEDCTVILNRGEFESADILAAQVLNNYKSSGSVSTDSAKKTCNCNHDCSSDCHNGEKKEEDKDSQGLTKDLEIYKMLLPMFKKNNLVTEDNKIKDGFDVVKMIALTYKNAYRRGGTGESFLFKEDVQSGWREMKPEDVYNTNLKVMYVNKPGESKHPEGPFDTGDGYFPPEGTVGQMSRPAWLRSEDDEAIWVRFKDAKYDNTCYGELFDCFLVKEGDENN